jgi:hypothetical protein
MVHVPDPNIVTFEPETVHKDVVKLVNVGVKPEEAVADTENAEGEYVRPDSDPKVIV